jgi:dTMP kinase
MSKKLIITFEGIEGSGKSFHLKNVANFLKKKKIKYIKLREPGGSKNSEIIRKIILDNKSNFNRITDLMLYFASRSENIEKIIIPNYKKKIILIDRFVDSTLAYQHYSMGINKNFINIINKNLLGKIKIDYTFLHIVNTKNMKLRLSKRKKLNRYDSFNMSFYRKAQNGFIKIANSNKKKYMIVDGNKNISDNKFLILNKIIKLLKD